MNLVKRYTDWSDPRPIQGHMPIGLVIGYPIAQISQWFGDPWYWTIAQAIIIVALGFTFQEWADDRANKKILLHFQKHQAPWRATDSGVLNFTGIRKTHEIWHGWDWRDWLGGVYGAVVGGILAVTLL